MTIAITLKVEDGLILAADSAATLAGAGGDVMNIYDHANKIVNLHKGLPIGIAFWGAGGIGHSSMSTLAKDLRQRFKGEDDKYSDWVIDPKNYSIKEVAERARQFFIQERYNSAFANWKSKPALGMAVAGYSHGKELAECYEISVNADGRCEGPIALLPEEDCGLSWRGEPEAIARLVLGHGLELPRVLQEKFGVAQNMVNQAMELIRQDLEITLMHPAMPIQDAIDLAVFLVYVSKQWSRFIPGSPTVGGPTEVAAITKHEGFKWVDRKFYYEQRLNPSTEGAGR